MVRFKTNLNPLMMTWGEGFTYNVHSSAVFKGKVRFKIYLNPLMMLWDMALSCIIARLHPIVGHFHHVISLLKELINSENKINNYSFPCI